MDCCVCLESFEYNENQMDCYRCKATTCAQCIQNLIRLHKDYITCPVCRSTQWKFYFSSIVLMDLHQSMNKARWINNLIDDTGGLVEYKKYSNELRLKKQGYRFVVKVGDRIALKYYHKSWSNMPMLLLLERMPMVPFEDHFYLRVLVDKDYKVDLQDDCIGIGDVIMQGSIVFNAQLCMYLRPAYTHHDILEEAGILMSSN